MTLPKVIDYADIWISKAAAFNSPVWLMTEDSVLPFPMPTAKAIKLKHNKKEFEYYKLYAGYDIETTQIDDSDKHFAFMYHWQFAIASDSSGMIFTGRTWQSYIHFIYLITEFYNLSAEKRIIVWDANLGYEFQYIRKLFDWDPEDFFAREERHPMKCRSGGIEYHEALTISGGSLGQLAKDFTKTQKLKGDLDFKVLRNSRTPLTKEELHYCENDVIILAEWSKKIFDDYIIPDKRIPLTKTGLLRAECRRMLSDLIGYANAIQYRKLIMEAFPDEATYTKWFKYLFRGGYVHSNILLTGYTIEEADGYDITSSYPAGMNLFNEYPQEAFKQVDYDPEYLKTHCCIFTATFKNIKRKYAHSIESKSKAIEIAGSKKMPLIIDNGRIAQAAHLKVMLTNLDFEIYKMFYQWDGVPIIEDFQISKKGPFPLFVRKSLNQHYKIKAALKQSGKSKTPEYSIEKQKVNSYFGMCITRIELDKITYDNESDDWQVQEKELDFAEELKSQFLLPSWGIFITAVSRWNLLRVVWEITEAIGDGSGENGAGVIYCDTDSIKVYDPEGKTKEIIDKYNEDIKQRLKKVKLTDPLFFDLGCFDFEGHYKRFKTLGAKRYLTEEIDKDGQAVIKATIAGLPKAAILNYTGDPFEKFNLDGMLIDAELSLKLGISYHDEPTDYEINGEMMHEESSAALFDMRFKMTLDKIYHTLVVEAMKEKVRKYGD